MKATIHTELRCGSCGQMMQYHQDTKVRCVQLKCEERNKEYLAPTVSLQPVEGEERQEGNFTATDVKDNWDKYWNEGEGYKTVKKLEEENNAFLLPVVERMEEIILRHSRLGITPGNILSTDQEEVVAETLYKDEREIMIKPEKKKRGRPKTTQD